LIVPWCHQEAEQRGLRGVAFTSRVERNERELIGVLKRDGITEGLIGRIAGIAVKTLPSAIYWSALATFGIRHSEEPAGRLERRLALHAETEELVDRALGMWHPTLPDLPTRFPTMVEGGLDLQAHEARWLRERILTTAPDTVLAHVLDRQRRPLPGSAAPWEDPSAADTTGELQAVLRDAELFSLALHGAALLYNLLVGERYEEAGLTRVLDPVETYREVLKNWAIQVAAHQDFAMWDPRGLWERVIAANPRIAANITGRRFVEAWLHAVMTGSAAGTAEDPSLRALVRDRERAVKRAQSRFINKKLLATWSGKSGSARLAFRWPQARRILTDVHAGLGEEGSNGASS
jgi:hypothetical protein